MLNEIHMKRALELAQSAMGHTSPNPMVGCVVVRDGCVVAEGCHEKYGGFHAERNALTDCGEEVRGADLYVTLEPCCHHGKTPPCTDIIIEKGIGRVFVGALDPNPKVAGNGVRILREHGIEVTAGILEEECMRLNEIFFHYITTGMPYVAMKYAMTLDGKIAAFTGDSKWVTGEKAREHVQLLRKKYSAIMAGVDTVIADDPMLNCRMWNGVDPVRIICDTHLRIPLESRIVQTAKEIPTMVACAAQTAEKSNVSEVKTEVKTKVKTKVLRKEEQLREAGVEVIRLDADDHVPLADLFCELGKRKIDSVLVEGGGTLHGSLLQTGLVNRVYAYIAPKLIGGKEAKSPIEGSGFAKMDEARQLSDMEIISLERDFCITGRLSGSNETIQGK